MQSFDDLMRPFIDALIGLYADKEACIRQMASEDTGPELTDYDVYGERVDTGARANGFPIWRYLRNDVHVCETEAGESRCSAGSSMTPSPACDKEPPCCSSTLMNR